MKAVKLFFVFLMFVLLAPFVVAELELYHFSGSKYNLGDSVLFSGRVVNTTAGISNLNIVLKCKSGEEQVGVEVLDLRDGDTKEFSRFVNLPNNLLGSCVVRLDLAAQDGKLIGSKVFDGFEVSNDLSGNFEISKNSFQLGESLNINGLVSKASGDVVDGTAVVYFKLNNANMFLDTVKIVSGSLSYTKDLIRLPAGEYKITIVVSDNFGNSHRFNDVFTFSITNNLDVSVNFDKNSYDPGDQLLLSGYVTNKGISNILLKFGFESGEIAKQLASNNELFSVTYLVQEKIKTGRHVVNITASDDKGNYGFKDVDYTVNARPTLLKLKLDDSSFDPGANIGFSVSLLDQAGDEMGQNVNVYLFNEKGDSVNNKIIKTGTSSGLLLSADAKPGSWKLSVDGLGLSDEASFNVREYQNLDVGLDGSSLSVLNKGNIPFKGALNIEAGDLKSLVNLKLKTGESKNIDLKKLFPSGTYKVKVPSLERIFDNVIIPKKEGLFSNFGFGGITGNAVKNVGSSPVRTGGFFIALAVIFGVVVLFLLGKKRNGKFNVGGSDKKSSSSLSSDKDYLLGKRKLEELKAKGIRKDKPLEYGKSTQEDVDYWKKKVQQTFEEQEKSKTKNEFLRFQEKSMKEDKPKPGLFNMFR